MAPPSLTGKRRRLLRCGKTLFALLGRLQSEVDSRLALWSGRPLAGKEKAHHFPRCIGSAGVGEGACPASTGPGMAALMQRPVFEQRQVPSVPVNDARECLSVFRSILYAALEWL